MNTHITLITQPNALIARYELYRLETNTTGLFSRVLRRTALIDEAPTWSPTLDRALQERGFNPAVRRDIQNALHSAAKAYRQGLAHGWQLTPFAATIFDKAQSSLTTYRLVVVFSCTTN